MSVSGIKTTEPKGVSKNASISTAAVVGAAVGLAARQILPVRKPEIDAVLFGETDRIKTNNINQARKNAINEIVKMFSKDKDNEALKLFLERTKASVKYANAFDEQNQKAKAEASKIAKEAKIKIKSAPTQVQKEIKKLTEQVINKVRAARLLSEGVIKSAVKQQRPYGAFILPAAALGVLSAFVYNVVGTINRD